MVNRIALLCYVLCLSWPVSFSFQRSPIDLTLVGGVLYADGLGRLGIGFSDIAKDDLNVNHISFRPDNFDSISDEVAQVIRNTDKTPGNVALLYFPVWASKELHKGEKTSADFVPEESLIKIAYSMIESDNLPKIHVETLNKKFDAIVVPDKWLKEAYHNSGIIKPIFILPHGIYIEDFLEQPLKDLPSSPFKFGSSASFTPRKNHRLLIDAFHKEFGNDPSVELVLHGRYVQNDVLNNIQRRIKEIGSKQIRIIHTLFSPSDYREFMNSLDCYVLLSKGEGFSVTPRESLALGIPTIITDNTAHKTIGKSGCAYMVTANIKEKCIYPDYPELDAGFHFNCTLKDAQKGLREVYENYQQYKTMAFSGREWVKQYQWKNIRQKFLTLVKPKKVVLGSDNRIENDCLVTSSEELHKKYCELIGNE